MNYDLPIFNVSIDEDDNLGVYETSLVFSPAMQEQFVALSEQIKLSIDNDKQIIIGPALIPDKLIYRINPETNQEFYIKFTKETIEKISQRFFKLGNQVNFNIEHSDKKINGFVFESWLTTENDKSKEFGYDLPLGTWMLSTKIEDKNVWDEYIKSGKVKGYSIEGNFNLIEKTELTSASNIVIIAEYDDLRNQKLIDYLSVRELMNRIIIFSDNPGVTKMSIRNQFGLFVDQVLINNYGRDLKSRLAWRGVQIAEISNRFRIIEGITSDFRVADMYRKLGTRTVQPTRLKLKPEDVKEIMTDLIKQHEKN